MFKLKIFLVLILSLQLQAQDSFDQVINVSLYGWLDQYSITDRGFVGNEACAPTSSTNGMTFLQNVDPAVFGTKLTGTTYDSWKKTDEILIDLMNTTAGNGTSDYRFVWGLNMSMALEKNFPQVQFSGIFPPDDWTRSYPQPSYIKTGFPTVAFISNALAAGSAVLVGITYNDGTTGGGHELLFNGLSWDPVTNEGTAYFIDPLDPSQNYSPDVPTGPVKQTKGRLTLNNDGSLELRYHQYNKGLPYDPVFLDISSYIDSVLSVGGSFYAAAGDPLEGNVQSIINGFAALDPTTASMFPVLAVLNTTDLEEAFEQFDPSIFNNLIFSEESVAHELEIVLNNNLLRYRSPFCWNSSNFCQRIWCAAFENSLHQQGGHQFAGSSYKNLIGGGVLGLDFLPCTNLLTGGGIAYARTKVNWSKVHARSEINSYGAFVYSAWKGCSWNLDGNMNIFYNKAKGHRNVFISSIFPIISPINERIDHKNHSMTYTAYAGLSYNLCSYKCIDIWPYANLTAIQVDQSAFGENGGGVLDLHVHGKGSKYFRSELGLGFTCNFENYVLLYTKFGYANETRFTGRRSGAYFNNTPSSEFTVYGVLPQNNLFCVDVLLQSNPICDTTRINISYHGELGSRLVANEISAEVNVGF